MVTSHSITNLLFGCSLNRNVSRVGKGNIDKTGIRGVIQFFFPEGESASEVHERIVPRLDDSVTVRLWVNKFQ